jgi:hypothetical protein
MRILTLSILFLLAITLAHAQDTTPEADDAWAIEQRCVAEPTTPPDDWTFDGTILMTGYAGVHAINDDWETPRIVVPGASTNALSPDGRWYAVPEGEGHQSDSLTHWDVSIHEIVVYSTETSESYSVPWDAFFHYSNSGADEYYVTWLDNERFIYYRGSEWVTLEITIVNPFTGEVTPWASPLDDSYDYFFSPDLTRFVAQEQVYDFATATALTDSLSIGAVDWATDSSRFVAVFRDRENELLQLRLYDRDGNLLDVMYTGQETELIPFNTRPAFADNMAWSADGRYLALETAVSGRISELGSKLYIMDMEAQLIYDTCLSIGDGIVWSPDGTQLAFIAAGRDHRAVHILDTASWSLYTVAYHTAYISQGVIGWRADN